MQIRTKLICTVGPAQQSAEAVEALIRAGMDVARINFSHGTHEEHAATIALLKAARRKLQAPLAIMLDTKGPELRLGKVKEPLFFKESDSFWLVKEAKVGDNKEISLIPPEAIDALKEGMSVFLDDGYITTQVVEVKKDRARLLVNNGGELRSNKGVNIPGASLDLPSLTEKDIADILFGCREDVDFIAASFICCANDIFSIKSLLKKEGKSEILVYAKIENRKGVENFESILHAADGIIVARGDLGVELPLSHVPRLQKKMIKSAALLGKPTVIATQMLESMIHHPRPTRAEVSDVANAVYDSTSAGMLSAETAIGRDPVAAVKMMKSIFEEAERDFDYYEFLNQSHRKGYLDVPSSVALSSIRTAYSAKARAILAFTTTGSTVHALSRFRPEMPILAMTAQEKIYHQLSLCWGVIPFFSREGDSLEKAYEILSQLAIAKGYVKLGDLVVITAGTPFGQAGTTNMMIVQKVGDSLVRQS